MRCNGRIDDTRGMKLIELMATLADCLKARSVSIPRPKQGGSVATIMRRLVAGAFAADRLRSSFHDLAADRGVEIEVADARLAHDIGKQCAGASARDDAGAPPQGDGGFVALLMGESSECALNTPRGDDNPSWLN